MTAIQMMTINTAEHFGLTKEMGMIAPGRWGDVLLVNDLMNFKADMVIAKGQVIAENGELQIKLPSGEISQLGDEIRPFEETAQGAGFCPSDKSS